MATRHYKCVFLLDIAYHALFVPFIILVVVNDLTFLGVVIEPVDRLDLKRHSIYLIQA